MSSQLPALFRVLEDDVRLRLLFHVALTPASLVEAAEALHVDMARLAEAAAVLADHDLVTLEMSGSARLCHPTAAVHAERSVSGRSLRVELPSGEALTLNLEDSPRA